MNLTPRIHLKKLNRHSISFSKSLFLASLKVYLCRTKIQILFLFFSIGVLGSATAQQYPVDCRISITPPYVNRFYDYQNSPQRFKVTLLLQDHTKPTLDVVLQIRLKGPGFVIENPEDFFTAQPITLNPGRPQTLSGLELSDNFSPANLETQGIELADLFTGGGLPPGPYEWEVRAFELYRDRQVSNTASFRMNLALNYPPLLNQPKNNAQLGPTQPQSINFNWMPRPSASLAASQGLLYTLMLYEVPLGEDPNAVVNSGSAPFRVIETGQTNYFYGPLEVPLEVGKTYAWQVKVSDINGQETYVNNGYSEVSWFRYGKACTAPENLKATEIGPNRVNLSWQADPQAMGYKLYYKNQTAADWQTQTTFGTSLTLAGLDQKEPYSFKISTLCDIDRESPTSPEITWEAEEIDTELQKLIDAVLHPLDQISSGTTPTASPKTDNGNTSGQPTSQAATDPLPTNIANLIPTDPTKIPCVSQVRGFENCSVTHDGVTLMGTEPLQSLAVGDPLTIYDMQAIVTEVSGGGGTYSGKALVKLPFLADMMMAVEFSNIEVKTEKPATYRGGCVTNVPASGFFRARTGLSREELKAEEVAFLDQIRKAQDPSSTYTTLGQQISQYDQTTKEIADATAAGQSLSTEQKETLLAQTIGLNSQISTWLENATDLIGGTTVGDAILAQIQTILDQLAANQTAIEAGTSFPSVPNIGSTITGIIDQIKTLLDTPPTDTPRIQNLQATKITDHSATLSWQGDKRFTKFIVIVQKPGEGERIFVVSGTKLTVENLNKSSNYNVKIVGYEGNQIVDEYQNGYFTTLNSTFPKPENLKISYLGEGKAKVTWDKNALHLKYKLKYTDKAGQIKYAYPTNNELELVGLASDDNFHLELVAFSKTDDISEPAVTDFESPNICNRFKYLEVSTNNILKGESVTISAPNCDSEVSWYANNSLVYVAGQSHTFAPSESTTYKARCTIDDPNYKVGKASCEISAAVEVHKKCENVNVTATPNQVILGNPILLRANSCEGKIQWLDKFPNGAPIVEDSKSVVIYPEPSKQYFLSCKDASGEICLSPAPQITVTCNLVLADNQLKQYHEKTLTYHDYIVKGVGCEAGTIKWTVTGGNSNLSTEEISPNTLRINKLRRFQDVEINASCVLGGVITCEVKHLIKGNLKNCDRFSEAGTITYLQDKILLKAPYLDKAIWDDIPSSPLVREVSLPVSPMVYTATLNQTVSFRVQKKYYYDGGFLSTYRVKIDKGCQVSFAVEPKIKAPNNSLLPSLPCTPFVASANPQVVERGQATVFLAQGCQDDAGNKGTIKWMPALPSNGVVEQTTTYSVTCDFAGQLLEQSLTLTVTEPVFKVSPFKTEILAGDPISLYASGCTSGYTGGQGTIKWSTGLTENAEKSKITVEPQKTITYTVSCDLAGKPTQTLYITVAVKEVGSYPADPCDFVVATDIDLFNISNPPSGNVKINIRGCYGNNLSWMTLSNNLENKANGGWKGTNANTVLDSNFPLTTTYRFRCQTNTGVCEKTITIPRAPRPDPVVISKDCRGYVANYVRRACVSKDAQVGSSSSSQSYNSITNGLTLEITEGQDKLKLVDNECYNQGGISWWYYDAARQKPLAATGLYYLVPVPTKNTTYYSKCVTKATTCLSSLTVTVCPADVGTLEDEAFALVEVSQEQESAANCGFISTQKALGDVLKSMICDNGKLIMAEPITVDKLEVLKNSILQQPIFDGLSLPTISDDMILKITAGGEQCKTAITDHVSGIMGTSLKEDYNNLATEPNLIDDVIENIDACINGVLQPLWETDGHFSTVYLIALQLGMSDNDARNLAIAAEDPDTDINFKTKEFIIDDTWSNGELQKIYHALNGGFHGIEEFLTALDILRTPSSNLDKLGPLIHRFGDTFAHTRLRSINPSALKTLNINNVNVEDGISTSEERTLQILMESWKKVSDNLIEDRIPEWVQLVNAYIRKYGDNPASVYKNGIWVNSKGVRVKLSEFLNEVYNINQYNAGRLRLYGCSNCFMTSEHATLDGGMADYIFVRGDWYISYVKNLAALLKYKFNLPGKINIDVFQRMVNYATTNKCSMRGVIDVEIALQNKKNNVDINKFLTKWQVHAIAAFLEDRNLIDPDLQYQNDVKRTRDYLINVKNKEIVNETNSLGDFTRFIFHNKCK